MEVKTNSKTAELRARALRVTPGAQTNLRTPFGTDVPIYVKGKAGHVWDADGNEFIDYTASAGPGFLGHSDPDFIAVVKDQLDTLYHTYTGQAQTPAEVELAEKVVAHVPCADKVRFCVTGTEAVQLALRLARAHTGRRYLIRFEGHYHGWLDNVLGGRVDTNPGGMPFPLDCNHKDGRTDGGVSELFTLGRDPSALDSSFLLPWNDAPALERVLASYGQEVAMVIMEPILCNAGCCPPRPGYLEEVRALCDRYGVVLCFDEIITGFRMGLSGAQGELGVTPDLSTFGKAIGGGLPIAAVAGRADIMDLLLDMQVIGAGTFNGHPLGMAAGVASIEILERDGGAYYARVAGMQQHLMDGIREIARRRGVPVLLQGITGVFQWMFTELQVAYDKRQAGSADTKRYLQFKRTMSDHGILLLWAGRWWLSGGLTDADIEKTLDCVDRVLV